MHEKEYMTAKEAALKWGITPRRVQIYIQECRISGCIKLGRAYGIPVNTEKPIQIKPAFPSNKKILKTAEEFAFVFRSKMREAKKSLVHAMARNEYNAEVEEIIATYPKLAIIGRFVAASARNIANACEMHGDLAYISGRLHNIGYAFGGNDDTYPLVGYHAVMQSELAENELFRKAAEICVTHAFPVFDENFLAKNKNYSEKDVALIKELCQKQDEYTRLVQFCTGVSVCTGWDATAVSIIHQVGELAIDGELIESELNRYKVLYEIQQEFEDKTCERRNGNSLYGLMPGVPLDYE